MAPATPSRSKRQPAPGTRFMAEVLGSNLRVFRDLSRLSQQDLAERMRALDHGTWVRQTVGEVEAARRSVGVDELLGLALALRTRVSALLSPMGLLWDPDASGVDLGGDLTLSPHEAERAIRSRTPPDEPEPALYRLFVWRDNQPQAKRADHRDPGPENTALWISHLERRRAVAESQLAQIQNEIDTANRQQEGEQL
ncbi:MAG: helix-turn-helix transcriptional regulator [Acidimicrobiia bacterium]